LGKDAVSNVIIKRAEGSEDASVTERKTFTR